jgi:Trypsin
MKLFTFLLGNYIVLFFSTIMLAGTIDPNTPDSKYIEYGSKFHNTVKLCCFDGKGLSCGSAVVIDPHWILTAAHVVENCQIWSVTIKDKEYKLDKVILNPDYKSDNFGYDDIALGYSKEKLVFDHYPALYELNDEVGKVCSMAGWGLTGTFNTGANRSDDKRRAGSNFIDGIERKVLMCSPSRRNEKITSLEFLIASGDSGGGLFIDGKLAGIHSSVVAIDKKPNSTYTDQSCHTRVSLYSKWIKKTMESCKDDEKKK